MKARLPPYAIMCPNTVHSLHVSDVVLELRTEIQDKTNKRQFIL